MPNATFMLTASPLDVTSAGACAYFGSALAGCAPLDFCKLKHCVAVTISGLKAQVYNCVCLYPIVIISVQKLRGSQIIQREKEQQFERLRLGGKIFRYSHKA